MHDLTTLLTWSSKVSVESSVTPRIFSTPLTVTLLPATVTLAGRVTRWSRYLVPKNATSDFVGFSSRPLTNISVAALTYNVQGMSE